MERDALRRHSRAAGVRREAPAEAAAHGAAALSLPDGRDFSARGLSAIAMLDVELAVPPGDAHSVIGAAAAPPIQGLLSGHLEPGSAGGSRRSADSPATRRGTARGIWPKTLSESGVLEEPTYSRNPKGGAGNWRRLVRVTWWCTARQLGR
jgi:hypothetical protein